ncbi:MAG: hypothetical protein K6T83_16175 [Alicyclobacillus sp.]|nr:hypothetical protein [Alicyclobacillus sp.]
MTEEELLKRLGQLPTPKPPSTLQRRLLSNGDGPMGWKPPMMRLRLIRQWMMSTFAVASSLVLMSAVLWYTHVRPHQFIDPSATQTASQSTGTGVQVASASDQDIISAVLAYLHQPTVNMTFIWKRRFASREYALVTYDSNGVRYVVTVNVGRLQSGQWQVFPGNAIPISRPSQLRTSFNIYPIIWGGGVNSYESNWIAVESGLVLNPAIVKVKITYSNGQSAVVPVRKTLLQGVRTFADIRTLSPMPGPHGFQQVTEEQGMVGLTATDKSVPVVAPGP